MELDEGLQPLLAHCYASAKLAAAADELTTVEAMAFFDDLAAFGVPAVLMSGGEPLVRPDFSELVEHGTAAGLRFTLSTNGILIDSRMAESLARSGIIYAGVSIDGDEQTHDLLRRKEGAYRSSIDGLAHLGAAGVRRGVRFTLTPDTYPQLDAVLDLVVREQVDRICVYHLVPSGRGGRLDDIAPAERLDALHRIFAFAVDHPEAEVLTVDNPSDGPILHQWLRERDEEQAERCREMLTWNRGATGGPGIGLAAVDERGDVHPDQFSRHRTFGNVRERPFSAIWGEPTDPYLLQLRAADRPVAEECVVCPSLGICGGGLRSRAELATGDPWGFDPSCNLVSLAGTA
ncbi:MAG: radical SAM protein [Acidimicrobiia bacterium]|nr:radical SAM protein [Acidimicrobiia bacterium]